MTGIAPAWSEPFEVAARDRLARTRPFGRSELAATIGDADGVGVTVAIVKLGVDGGHPAIGGSLVRSVRVELEGERARVVDDDGGDLVGHGTACAGIIHAMAPGADLVSVRVLGPDNKGKGLAFATALRWAIGERIGVLNLSLSSRSEVLAGRFHDLADAAYFSNSVLVCAANNVPGPSYPSLFASVISVAAHDGDDPWTWFYNPSPPVEFGAHGVEVDVAWRDRGRIRATGNSFAAPHIAGVAARVRQAYPDASPFEVKAILAALAADPADDTTT